jgi:hypothetical protein
MELKRFFPVFVPLAIATFAIAALTWFSQSAAVFAASALDDVGGPEQPTVSAVIALQPVAQVNTGIGVTIFFTDPGVNQLQLVQWDWGDGSTTDCLTDAACTMTDPVGEALQVFQVSATHAFTEPDVYSVQFTVANTSGQFATSTYEFLVVYDPNGGFVTGGGWIDSPAGAYKSEPGLEGKATFGFVSKYKKGLTVPVGNTEFQFQVAGLNFHSDTYDWLVVNQNGSNAQFKGEGTINGAGEYKFMIWAGDGSPDTFRIKIWPKDGSGAEVVYDNGFEGSGYENGQPIGGGGIMVHAPKGGN